MKNKISEETINDIIYFMKKRTLKSLQQANLLLSAELIAQYHREPSSNITQEEWLV
jgi:hypothetical protein